MTDNEIIKALECCGDPHSVCAECPIKDDHGCNEQLANYALDIINRQQAEIEKLESANDEKFSQWYMLTEKTKQHYADLYNEAKDILKAEAIKEFAKRLKCGLPQETGVIRCSDVDSLVKEMVGEKE